AWAVWNASPRKNAPFIKFNCAAVPENLMESELFGHERGAFTGAHARRDGRFQLADGGTLLLDEISEIPIGLQAKLLRVLQESEFERVGSNKTIKVDVRILATTNRNLKISVEKGEFREDLYYRLNVFPIHIPPLRERRDDVELLLRHYMQVFAVAYGKEAPPLDADCLARLKVASWKGNIRELQNATARAVILWEPGRALKLDDFAVVHPASTADGHASAETAPQPAIGEGTAASNVARLEDMEKHAIEKALVQTSGNKTHAARLLGISVRTLRNKLREYRMATAAEASDAENEKTA
ncbi:MAG: sigma-54-dependent Fis family transcriptional regulator, partial [Verrucomicrobia bacterium]|nr:sigma-54-dependent Fis family transcriptional regulator [Verrucomicrobiota bacterium]